MFTNSCLFVTGLSGVVCKIGALLSTVLPVLIILGVVYFVWGVVMFVISDSEEAKTKGKDKMIYGIIGLAVIIGMWGLVGIVIRTFGINNMAPTQMELQNLLPR
jgi:NADH:ubiquinone oxidoreductase subunit 6 (subunit J)